jgi:hypothetical protein
LVRLVSSQQMYLRRLGSSLLVIIVVIAVMLIQCSNLREKLNWCDWFPVSKCT